MIREVKVNADQCLGCGNCERTCRGIFRLAYTVHAEAVGRDYEKHQKKLLSAYYSCPVQAIELEGDDPSLQIAWYKALIVEKKKLVGFISQSDILWALTKKSSGNLKNVKAIEISPKKIITIKPDATLTSVIEKMKKMKLERLPVIHENEVVGIITAKDILNFNPEVYPEIEEFSKIRQESEKLKRIKEAEKRREGICEECGSQGILFKANGMLVCENCRDKI